MTEIKQSGAAYAELPALFREALAWGKTYGPGIPAHQWDEMRESMVKHYTDRASRGQAPAPAAGAVSPEGWPQASAADNAAGWTLDYKFLEKVEALAKTRTEYSTSMEATEQVLIAALEVLAAAPKAEPELAGEQEEPRTPDGIVYTSAAQDVLEEWFEELGLDMDVEEAKKLFDKMTAACKTQSGAGEENLRKALKFYADGDHFIRADQDAWDTVSGEPPNYWCDEAGTATVEDGSIAKLALAGHVIQFEGEAATAPSEQAPAQPAAEAGPSEHYDEVRATLTGLHALCENVSAQERRIGPLGSHARGYTWKITAALRHLDALAAAPTAKAAPVAQGDAMTTGLIAAAEHIEGMASGYIQEHAYTEPDTGAVVFDRRDAGEDYYNTLVELAEDLRAMAVYARAHAQEGGANA